MNFTLKPALCLDLDGTVRITKSGKPFAENLDDVKLNGDIEKIIWKYRRDYGYLIFGISNQGGVAWGFKKPLDVELELQVLFSLFDENPFHAVKHAYHDEKRSVEPYNHRSLFRKPNIGMLAECETDAWKAGYVVDWKKSLFVGDRPEDEQCAKNADIPFQYINSFLQDHLPMETKSKPLNLEEAIDFYTPKFEGMEDYIKDKTEDQFAAFCHSQLSGGIGMKIRNEMGFWTRDTELYRYMTEVLKKKHPDDMSDEIIRGIFRRMKQ